MKLGDLLPSGEEVTNSRAVAGPNHVSSCGMGYGLAKD
jgi:hypothetical protein